MLLRTEVVDAEGAAILSEVSIFDEQAFGASSFVEHRVELPLQRLEPGDYLLRFVGTTEKVREQREVRFSVRPEPLPVTNLRRGSW